MSAIRFELAGLVDQTEQAVSSLCAQNANRRLWERDYTLFSSDPSEISNRMGWTDCAHDSLAQWADLCEFAAEVADSFDRVVVMGMGGSSLFPEVLARSLTAKEGYPSLVVLDSTHPDAVQAVAAECSQQRTFFLASSKSGSTVETRSQLEFFWQLDANPNAFAVVTDPGSNLEALALDRGFRRVFLNDPDIGGRFSALSLFGMVPAALGGFDGEAMLNSALEAADALSPGDDDESLNMALQLGAALAVASKSGRQNLTLLLEPGIEAYGLWLEQLIAESLGKHGLGVVPLAGEPAEIIEVNATSRFYLGIGDHAMVPPADAPQAHMSLETLEDLGAISLIWQFAVAFAGVSMGINPFDQPDVESAKAAARGLLDGSAPAAPNQHALGEVLSVVGKGDYVAICGFVNPRGDLVAKLEEFRNSLTATTGAVASFGIGPRFLHSTGQLHKGGPDNIVVIQFFEEPIIDVEIPGESFTFGQLFTAQAAGDLGALATAGKRCFRVSIDEL